MSSAAILPKSEIRKVLIVRLGAMGDIVHALPAAGVLRRELPEARIDWLLEPRWAPLLEGSGMVDRVVPLPLQAWRRSPFSGRRASELLAAVRGLRAEHYDLALDLQGLFKSAITARAAGAGRTAGFAGAEARESAAAALYRRAYATGKRHVVERYAELARLTVGGAEHELTAALPAGEESPDLPHGEFVLASPLAGWKSKQWPPERYAELASILHRERGLPLVLDCAPGDIEYCRRIGESAPAGACLAHPSTIRQLIGATRRAVAVIGVDSGPLHVAAALRRPGVALYGPTDPARNGPYGGTFQVLRRDDAETSYKRRDDFSPSMSALSAEQVWASLAPLIGSRRRSTADVGN